MRRKGKDKWKRSEGSSEIAGGGMSENIMRDEGGSVGVGEALMYVTCV